MEKIRLNCLLLVVFLVLLGGCTGGHMKEINVAGENLKNIAGVNMEDTEGTVEKETSVPLAFKPYRIIKIEMPRAAFFSEGIFGGNYFLGFLKDDVEEGDMSKIRKSADLFKSEIVVENGVPYLYLFDTDDVIDLDRKVLVQTRVVSGGHQHSIGGKIISGPNMRKLDWEPILTLNQYVEDGLVVITEVDDEDSDAHKNTVKLAMSIIERYRQFGQESSFERFLKSIGSFSSNDVNLMIAGSLNPVQIYPLVAVKFFDIIKFLTGAVDTSKPGYETSVLTAFQQGVALDRYYDLIKGRIQSDIYTENALKNASIFKASVLEQDELMENEVKRILDWQKFSLSVMKIDSDSNVDDIGRAEIDYIKNTVNGYIAQIKATYQRRINYFKVIYNQ